MSGAAGALEGLRVVELASEHAAFAGKMLADLGADVIVIEPPGGHPSRAYGPFVDDVDDPERSLWWWHYNTSQARRRARPRHRRRAPSTSAGSWPSADIVLEGEPPDALRGARPRPHRPARRARPS